MYLFNVILMINTGVHVCMLYNSAMISYHDIVYSL